MLKKKRLVIALIAIAATVGITTGVVFAQGENEDANQPESILERVCEIYEDNTGVAIKPEALKDAFIEANEEIITEAIENRLDKLVEKGVITQEEADQLKEWWQAKPDVSLPSHPMLRGGPGGRFGPRLGGFGSPRGQFIPDEEATTETSLTY